MEARVPLFSLIEAQKENTVRAIKHVLKTTCNERGQMLWIAAGGYEHWMQLARESFKGFLVDDTILSEMFDFIKREAGPEPGKQLDALLKGNVVGLKVEFLAKIAAVLADERHLDEFLEGKALGVFQKAAIRQELLRLINARRATVH